MIAWLYRLFRLLFIYWKFRTNRIPAPRPPEERLREIDAALCRELAEWDGNFRKLYPPARTTIPDRVLASTSMVRLVGFSAPTYSSDVSPGWHHVPNTSRWEKDEVK